MTQEQLASLFRTLIQVGGTALGVTWMNESITIALAGALATLAATAWGIWARSKTNLVASAAEVKGVQQIITSPSSGLASDVPSPKVV